MWHFDSSYFKVAQYPEALPNAVSMMCLLTLMNLLYLFIQALLKLSGLLTMLELNQSLARQWILLSPSLALILRSPL